MKNIVSILLVSALLIGCSKSNDNPNSGSILGTWEVVTYETNTDYGYIDPVFGTEILIDYDKVILLPNPEPWTIYLVFRYDNTYTYYEYYQDTLRHQSDGMTYVKVENEVSTYNDEGSSTGIIHLTTLAESNLNLYFDYNKTTLRNDTTFFEYQRVIMQTVKSELPSITVESLNKNKPVSSYDSFLNRKVGK